MQCGIWQSIHIDDVRPFKYIPAMIDMYGQSGASIISEGIQEKLQNLSKLNITQKQNVVKENEENIETPDNSVKKESMVIEKQGNIEKSDNSGKKESMVIKRTLKIEHFIHDCIQRALAALKDPEDDTSRTTERLKNTLRLLDNSEGTYIYLFFLCTSQQNLTFG